MTGNEGGPALAAPTPKTQQANPDSIAAALPSNRCRACRRPTATSICGKCRAVHAYLTATGARPEVRS